jgi:hypothetical protein
MPWRFEDFDKVENLNPNDEGYEGTIKNRLGDFPVWHVVTWNRGHWIKARAGSDHLYAQRSVEEAAPADLRVDDGDHILFFPMDHEGLCPRSWIEAAWPFLEHFRSNFCFYPQEAFMYRQVTLLGPPLGTRRGIGREVEDALGATDWRQVERIWCTSAGDLAGVLARRMEEDVRFRGEDELAPEGDEG